MAEAQSETPAAPRGAGGKLFGWLRAGMVSVGSLLAGAAMMYATSLVDQIIKPAAPVANFQADPDGLKVVFHNRSSGGREGWWDFGDGTALEPFVPDQNATHTYAKPGVYTVKLTLKNLLSEANDRSATLTLDSEAPTPAIDEFTVTPVQAVSYAPATYRVAVKFKNANVCVWSVGDDQPLEVAEDAPTTQERMVTFKQPGTHFIRFAAFNGKQTVERSEQVTVAPAPAGLVTATVQVAYEAMRVRPVQKVLPIVVAFPADVQDTTFSFSKEYAAENGFMFTQAQLGAFPPEVKSPNLEISADKKRVTLTGQLVKQGGLLNRNAPLPMWSAQLVLTQEWRGALGKQAPQVSSMALNVPGVTELELPKVRAGWVAKSRTLDLELRKDGDVLWRGTQLPRGAVVNWGNNQAYALTITEAAGKLRVEVAPAPGVVPVGN